MANYEVDFNGLDDTTVAVVSTDEIPDDLWGRLRDCQFEAIIAQLPGETNYRYDRAGQVMRMAEPDAFNTYKSSRVRPSDYVGAEGWWDAGQVIDNSRAAILYQGPQAVGAVIAERNVSYSHGPWEKYLKQMLPVTNFLRLREGYIHPDVHRIDTSRDQRTVSGLIVAGIQQILAETNRFRKATSYIVPGDPADAEREGLAQILGMQPNPSAGKHTSDLPGYTEDTVVVRMEGRVDTMRNQIARMPGASEALGRVVLLDGLKQTA